MVIAAVVACIVLLIILLEILSLKVDPDKVLFTCEKDMELTEPDEVASIRYRLGNTAAWPLMFVSFSFTLNDALEIREDDKWKKIHGSESLLNSTYTFDTFLLPHRTYSGSIRFSVKKRGKYDIGKVYIETGDFLGFKTRVSSFALNMSIVCTARRVDDEDIFKALGGTIGDISVRRFIMEDPSLVWGYREYTGREPMKSISWAQTAKTDQLTVKKHDFTVDDDVAVFADCEHTDPETVERCLSLLRTACDMLEEAHIPYALHSNGDLFNTEKGSGRMHLFEIQRRIGVSSYVRYTPFSAVAKRFAGAGTGQTGCILVAPELTPDVEYLIKLITDNSGATPCVLLGKEDCA